MTWEDDVLVVGGGTGTLADVTGTIHARPTVNTVVEDAAEDAAAQL